MITSIWEYDLPHVEKIINRYQKISQKYNRGSIVFDILDTEYVELTIDGHKDLYKFYKVSVSGQVKFDDWELLALTDDVGETMNRVRIVSNKIDDSDKWSSLVHEFHHSELRCDHCKCKRNRKHTAWVENTSTGEILQLGYSCMKLYTKGLSAEHAAMYSTLYNQLSEFDDFEDRIRSYSGVYETLYPIEDAVCVAQFLVDFDGFKSRGSVYDGINNIATADQVTLVLQSRSEHFMYNHSHQYTYIQELCKKYGHDILSDTEYKLEDSRDCIAYFREFKECSDSFDIAVRQTYLLQYVTENDFGVLCAAIKGWNKYKKELEEKRRRKEIAENSKSEYLGSKGQKLDIQIQDVEYVTAVSGMFGITYLYKFHDTSGNEIIWWSSRYIDDIEDWEGKTMNCSVKDHTDWYGVKQTSVVRCRLSKKE